MVTVIAKNLWAKSLEMTFLGLNKNQLICKDYLFPTWAHTTTGIHKHHRRDHFSWEKFIVTSWSASAMGKNKVGCVQKQSSCTGGCLRAGLEPSIAIQLNSALWLPQTVPRLSSATSGAWVYYALCYHKFLFRDIFYIKNLQNLKRNLIRFYILQNFYMVTAG